MSQDVRIDALEDCLRRLQAGESLEQVLASYPSLADELRPMLRAARSLRVPTQIPQGAQARSRSRMLAAAAQRRQRHLLGFFFPASRLKLALTALAAILVFGAVGTGIASAQALPGDAFYTVKLATERTRLFLAGDSPQGVELQESFDRQRAQEVQTLLAHARVEQVTFAGYLAHAASGQWTAAGIALQFPAGVSMDPALHAGMYVVVQGVAQSDGSVLVKDIHLDEIQFKGRIQSIKPDVWVVAGVSVHLTAQTRISSPAQVGDSVTVNAIRLSGDVLQAQWLEVASTQTAVASPSATPVPPRSTATSIHTSEPEDNEPTETPEPQEAGHTPEPTQAHEGEQQPTATGHEGEDDHRSQATATPNPANTITPTQAHEGDHEEHATQTPTGAPSSTSPTPASTQHDD